MDAILKLPYELQIAFVAGYLAYKIVSIGKGRTHRTEDFVLQVLTFGVLSRAVVAILGATSTAPQYLRSDEWPEAAQVAVVAGFTSIAAVLLGAIWRVKGEDFARSLMNRMRVYNDDHEASTWQSIMQKPASWTVIQIHLENDTVLEANFGKMNPSPKHPVVINEDGVGMYITGRYDAEGNFTEWGITGNEDDIIFTYIPRDTIKRMDVAWRLARNDFNDVEA